VLFPDDAALIMPGSRFIRTIRPNIEGRFAISGLPAGRYLAAAVEVLIDGQWFDPVFLEGLRKGAVPVTLNEGGAESVTLRLP
jgi:hypothetical protein